jgi:hypothetical protein
MYYEINVSFKGTHFFATAERSLTTEHDCRIAYEIFKSKFPVTEGYEISVTENQHIGKVINL